jgi:hypothetical protein
MKDNEMALYCGTEFIGYVPDDAEENPQTGGSYGRFE